MALALGSSLVLTVDDLDLNPAACLDVLRLLRLVSVPRLFILVLGDPTLTNIVLKLKFSSDFAAVSGSVADMYRDEIEDNASKISDNVLRKLIPPGQRVDLGLMTVQEALDFRPLGQTQARTLSQLLTRVHMPAAFREASKRQKTGESMVHDLLVTTGLRVIEPVDGDEKEWIYSGRHFLAATPRQVTDVWYGLQRSLPPEETGNNHDPKLYDAVLDRFAARCRTVLAEELPPAKRLVAENAIRKSTMGRWELGPLPVTARAIVDSVAMNCTELTVKWPLAYSELSQPELLSTSPGTALPRDYVCSMRIGQHRGWRFEGGTGTGEPQTDMLSRATGSALILYHDLLVITGQDGSSLSPLIEPDGTGYPWALTEWHEASQSGVKLEWPAPPCSSFWELERFVTAWHHAVARMGTTPRPENLAFVWLSAGTAICDGQAPVPLASMESEETAWPELVQRLERLTERRPGESSYQVAQEWLVRVALLMMPEMGLPADAVTKITVSETLHGYWKDKANLISRRRAHCLAALIKDDLGVLAEDLRVAQRPCEVDSVFWPDRRQVEEFAGQQVNWQREQTHQMERVNQQLSSVLEQMSTMSAGINKQEERFDTVEARLEAQGSATDRQFSTLQDRLAEQEASATRRIDTPLDDQEQHLLAEECRVALMRIFGFSEKTSLENMVRQALGRKTNRKSDRFREILNRIVYKDSNTKYRLVSFVLNYSMTIKVQYNFSDEEVCNLFSEYIEKYEEIRNMAVEYLVNNQDILIRALNSLQPT